MSIEVEAKEQEPTLRRTATQAWDYGEYIVVPSITIVGPRLLVIPPQVREFKTGGGIVIPEHAQQKASRGLIVLVGDGVTWDNGHHEPSRYKPGMEIVYAKYAGVELELGQGQYLIIQESDVRCIIEEHKLNFG